MRLLDRFTNQDLVNYLVYIMGKNIPKYTYETLPDGSKIERPLDERAKMILADLEDHLVASKRRTTMMKIPWPHPRLEDLPTPQLIVKAYHNDVVLGHLSMPLEAECVEISFEFMYNPSSMLNTCVLFGLNEYNNFITSHEDKRLFRIHTGETFTTQSALFLATGGSVECFGKEYEDRVDRCLKCDFRYVCRKLHFLRNNLLSAMKVNPKVEKVFSEYKLFRMFKKMMALSLIKHEQRIIGEWFWDSQQRKFIRP